MFKSLYSRLLACFLLLSTLPILIVGYMSYQSERSRLTSYIRDTLLLAGNNMSLEIKSHLTEQLSDVKQLAQNPYLANSPAPSIDLKNFWQAIDSFALQRHSLGREGYAFLFNSRGDLIAHPDRSKILNENVFTHNGLTLMELRRLIREKTLYSLPGDHTLVAFSNLEPVQNIDLEWFVGVAVPEDELYQPLQNLVTKDLMIFGIILIIINLLSIYLARSIVRPLRTLASAAAEFGAERKNPCLQVATYSEISILAETINEMADRIADREKALIRSEKLKAAGEVAAGFAHEIRNPLTTIRGFLQMYSENSGGNAVKQEYFPLIIQELDRINQTISEFLNLAKPVTVAENVLVNLPELIDDILLLKEAQADAQNIDLVKQMQAVPALSSNPQKLKQIFLNLIQNSFEAMPRGGKLTLKTGFREKENTVVVEISDTGTGIAKETLGRLGTPFYTTKSTGTGIGLMISYQLIEHLNGKVSISSKLGVGTTFTLAFPAANLDSRGASRSASLSAVRKCVNEHGIP